LASQNFRRSVRLHRYVYAAVLAAICAFAFIPAAHAATGRISPSGAINARGNLTLGTSGGSKSCNLSLNGTLLSTASGTLGWGNLTTNPIIGSITSGSINCNVGTASVLFVNPTSWTIRNYAQNNTNPGGRGDHYIQGVQFLFDVPGVLRCLYRATLRFFTTNGSNIITLGDGVTQNLQLFTTINLGICPLGTPTLRGTMALTQGGVAAPIISSLS
jgi:hypothetical protein